MEDIVGGKYETMRSKASKSHSQRRHNSSGQHFDRDYFASQHFGWGRGDRGRERDYRSEDRPCLRSPPPRRYDKPRDYMIPLSFPKFLCSCDRYHFFPTGTAYSSKSRTIGLGMPLALSCKKSIMGAIAAARLQEGDIQARMEETRGVFPEICFNRFLSAPTIKRIPDVHVNVHIYIHIFNFVLINSEHTWVFYTWLNQNPNVLNSFHSSSH